MNQESDSTRFLNEAKKLAKDVSSQTKKKAKRLHESFYRDSIASSIEGAKTEVKCTHGAIDVFTDKEIIEVKKLKDYKAAIGQIICYRHDHPTKKARIHFLLKDESEREYLGSKVIPVCTKNKIKVTYDYEKQPESIYYKVGPFAFNSASDLNNAVSLIQKSQRQAFDAKATSVVRISHYYGHEVFGIFIEGIEKEFMLNLINEAYWTEKSFEGEVTDIGFGNVTEYIYHRGRYLSDNYLFVAKSKTMKELRVFRPSNYIKQAITSNKVRILKQA